VIESGEYGIVDETQKANGTAALTPKRSRTTNITPFVEEIAEYGYQYGFGGLELGRIVDVVHVRNELDQTSLTTVIRNLYPAERISQSVLLKVINALGQGQKKPNPATQTGLVKWMAAIHEFLAEPDILLQLYGVLFNLLDITTLRYVFRGKNNLIR
jgi:centromere protein I